MGSAETNRILGLAINTNIWNGRRYELLHEYFHEDFVADYSPYAVRQGIDAIREMVERAHATFEGFKETVKTVVADDHNVVLHFTITGRQIGHWGAVPPTGRFTEHDEIVIMSVDEGRVRRQVGIVDNLLALRQLGVIPQPRT